MSASICINEPAAGPFEIRFESLFDASRGFAFPCDARGRVDLDALSPRARSNYLYARALVGRDYVAPHVRPAPPPHAATHAPMHATTHTFVHTACAA